MPTPFTHLAAAQRLLADDTIAPSLRALLEAECPAFLLGSVAADARPPGTKREDTHFYTYDSVRIGSPWRTMLNLYPSLQPASSAAQRAFIAGYVAHLAMDRVWTELMLRPHFVHGDWGTGNFRFLMLHALLITMDERDLSSLEPWQHPVLAAALPDDWLPFIPDTILIEWRDFIAEQIKPGGESQTLEVFGARINRTPDELRELLDSPEQMHLLWQNVTPDALAKIEMLMYSGARAEMSRYLIGGMQLSDFKHTWGNYGWITATRENLIHPDDVKHIRFDRFIGRVFYCSDITEDGYLVLNDADHRYRVRPDSYHPRAEPVFCYRDIVRDKVSPDRVGKIYHIEWHYKHEREFYNLRFDHRESTRRYFSDELELVEKSSISVFE